MSLRPHPHAHQTGAALVVGLVLLLAITLMAVTTMNSASLNLLSISNEPFKIRAFQAAETAIEVAILNDSAFDSSKDFSTPGYTLTGNGKDAYRYVVSRPLDGAFEPPPPGYSTNRFSAIYFRISATGISDRKSTAESIQELFQIVPTPDGVGYSESACKATSSLDAQSNDC